MEILYTARGKYNKDNIDNFSWDKYKDWTKMYQLEELVSLDGLLNELLVEPDYNNDDDWKYIHTFDNYQTGFFTDVEYIFKRLSRLENYNLLAIAIEPEQKCDKINLNDYDFIGYDLLDQDFGISALTNCGGFDETFSPSEVYTKGLIDDYERAYDIKEKLLINNPDEHHADTNVIAVWRHRTFGK